MTGERVEARHRRDGDPPHGPVESSGGEDAVLAALEDLTDAVERMAQAITMVSNRAAEIRACRERGMSYRAIVHTEDRPLIAGMLTETIARFEAAGTGFRQAQARALHQEGMTMEQIADLFGLTRQRISVLLHTPSHR